MFLSYVLFLHVFDIDFESKRASNLKVSSFYYETHRLLFFILFSFVLLCLLLLGVGAFISLIIVIP